jgi:transcriptional regulator with XRE-family HTH domain
VSAGRRTPAEVALGDALRLARARTGMSLAQVEVASGGRFRAVAVGSWERADRAVSAARLLELAEFYRVPAASLLPGGSGGPPEVASAAAFEEAAAELQRRAADLRAEVS